jgi:hypothetical protein
MKVRRFNDNGIDIMGQFIDSLNSGEPTSYPEELLTDMDYTKQLDTEVEIEKRNFSNKFEVGEYFNSKFNNIGIENIKRDRGLWSWLALYYFNEICAVDSDGQPKPGERARWIPAVWDFQKYYRHLLAGPYRIYNAYQNNPQTAFAILCTSADKNGDVVEQLSARQELVTNPAIMEAATKLYVDKETDKHKYGSGGKGPGSPRRLSAVLSQFDLIWDLYSLDADDILEMLPSEFDRFMPEL